MSAETPGSVTQLLTAIGQGDPSAESRPWSIVYDELRRMAHAQRRHEGQAAARETTSLVNEGALRLLGAGPQPFFGMEFIRGRPCGSFVGALQGCAAAAAEGAARRLVREPIKGGSRGRSGVGCPRRGGRTALARQGGP